MTRNRIIGYIDNEGNPQYKFRLFNKYSRETRIVYASTKEKAIIKLAGCLSDIYIISHETLHMTDYSHIPNNERDARLIWD